MCLPIYGWSIIVMFSISFLKWNCRILFTWILLLYTLFVNDYICRSCFRCCIAWGCNKFSLFCASRIFDLLTFLHIRIICYILSLFFFVVYTARSKIRDLIEMPFQNNSHYLYYKISSLEFFAFLICPFLSYPFIS